VIVDAVTQRYADALYGLAKAKSALSAVAADVEKLAQSVNAPALRDAVTNPRRERGERRRAVLAVADSMHPYVQNLVNLLFDKHREEVLIGIGRAIHKLRLDEKGQVEGVVESARPLGPNEMAQVAKALGRELGKELVLSNRVVPELIGGARVIAANRMIDYSVQGRLEALRRKLMDAPLPNPRA
jgi:F-type H+-transporting ATPase subunit delta